MSKKARTPRGQTARELTVKRPQLPKAAIQAAVSRFESGITAALERDLASLIEHSRHLDNVSAPVRKLLAADPRTLASGKALYRINEKAHERRMDAIRKGRFEGPATAFNFTANPGWQMLAPPYDVGWQTGGGFADKFDGKMWAFIGDGFSAAAVGVFLSVPTPSLVRFRPMAPYTYNWGNLAFRGPASCNGGVGVLAYVSPDPRPSLDRRSYLWSDAQVPPHSANGSGSGHLADHLWGDVLIVMQPGNTYLLWTWIWGMGRSSSQEERLSLSLAQISCRVAAVVVDAGPVPVIK